MRGETTIEEQLSHNKFGYQRRLLVYKGGDQIYRLIALNCNLKNLCMFTISIKYGIKITTQ